MLFSEQFFQAAAFLKKNTRADLKFVGPVPPTHASGIDFNIWLKLNERLLQICEERDFSGFFCCSKLIGHDLPNPLNEYESFDETHISSTSAYRICENLIGSDSELYWGEHKYVEKIREDELGEVKIIGNIAHGDMEISEVDTINFHTLHCETFEVERYIQDIIDNIKLERRPSICSVEDSEGFISRLMQRKLPNCVFHRVFRSQNKWRKAKRIDDVIGVQFMDFYLSDPKLYLNN